jgi:hypothetical protein
VEVIPTCNRLQASAHWSMCVHVNTNVEHADPPLPSSQCVLAPNHALRKAIAGWREAQGMPPDARQAASSAC